MSFLAVNCHIFYLFKSKHILLEENKIMACAQNVINIECKKIDFTVNSICYDTIHVSKLFADIVQYEKNILKTKNINKKIT